MSKIFSKGFKPSFVKVIKEALDDHQKDTVDFWLDHHDEAQPNSQNHEAIHNVFKGADTIKVPLEHYAEPHPDVEEHLAAHGFEIHDYANGKCRVKGGDAKRELRIGATLNKTKAHPSILKSFEEDPTRASAKKGLGDYVAHITVNPHHVAGMTSGNQSWVNQSCMNFHDGSNKDYLPKELGNGTHVAYLAHKDDHKLENPISRIAIKPFESEENHDDDFEGEQHPHTIFRAEKKTYGAGNTAFTNTINKWAEKSYPAQPKTVYRISEGSYPDTHDTINSLGKAEVENHYHAGLTLSGDAEQSDHNHYHDLVMKHGLKDKSNFYVNQVAHRHSPEKVNDLYSKLSSENKLDGMHTDISNTHMATVLNRKNFQHHTENLLKETGEKDITGVFNNNGNGRGIIGSKHLPSSVVDNLEPNRYEKVHPDLLKSHHYDKAIDSYLNNESGSVYPLNHLHNTTKFTPSSEHIHKIVDNGKHTGNIMYAVATSKHFGKDHYDKMGSHDQRDIRAMSPHVKEWMYDENAHASHYMKDATFDKGFIDKFDKHEELSGSRVAPYSPNSTKTHAAATNAAHGRYHAMHNKALYDGVSDEHKDRIAHDLIKHSNSYAIEKNFDNDVHHEIRNDMIRRVIKKTHEYANDTSADIEHNHEGFEEGHFDHRLAKTVEHTQAVRNILDKEIRNTIPDDDEGYHHPEIPEHVEAHMEHFNDGFDHDHHHESALEDVDSLRHDY